MSINLNELRAVSNLLFDHLLERGIVEVELSEDYYWSIPDTSLYCVYREPKDLTIGQLSADLESLAKIRSGEQAPIGYAFVWLSSVLRFLGTKTGS